MRSDLAPSAAIPFGTKTGMASADGTAYAVYGTGAPLVLIHGVGMNQSVWAPQVAELARRRMVIVYDVLGHGRSRLPPENAKLVDYAGQLVNLLRELKLEAVDVAGHSMGALVALELAVSQPNLCRSVTAINAVFRRTPAQRRAVQQRAAQFHAAGIDHYSESTLARWFGDPVPMELQPAFRLVLSILREIDPIGYARTYSVFANSDEAHVDALQSLKMPALFMTGEFDPNSTPAMSETMAKLAPFGQVAVLGGEKHMMNVTAPAAVNRCLENFLNAVDASNSRP